VPLGIALLHLEKKSWALPACPRYEQIMASDKVREASEIRAADKQAPVDLRADHDEAARLKAMDRVIQGAKMATEREHKMTLMQGIRLYPKAILWSILISTCIVMEGYDICLINNFCLPSLPTLCSLSLTSCSRRLPAVQQEVRRGALASRWHTHRELAGACPLAGWPE